MIKWKICRQNFCFNLVNLNTNFRQILCQVHTSYLRHTPWTAVGKCNGNLTTKLQIMTSDHNSKLISPQAQCVTTIVDFASFFFPGECVHQVIRDVLKTLTIINLMHLNTWMDCGTTNKKHRNEAFDHFNNRLQF